MRVHRAKEAWNMRWRMVSKSPIIGEKRFVGLTNEGAQKTVVAQICDVNRGLLSVKKVTNSGITFKQSCV